MSFEDIVGPKKAAISRRYFDMIDDVYSRIEISYNSMTDEYVLLCDQIGDEDWMLEAYVGGDGYNVEIIRNDCGMHDARERFELLLSDWAEQLCAASETER